MFNRSLKDRVYCGLDIGSHNLKVGLIKIEDDRPEVIGAYEQPVYGFKDSSVSDLNEFSECINHALNELLEKTGVQTKDIQIGLDGSLVDVRKSSTAIPLVDRGNKVIASRDIKKLNKQARLLGVKMEEEVLHEMPQMYQIDDVNSAANPIGLYGRKLGVDSMMIVSNVDRVKNILKSVHHAGYDVSNLFFGSYISSSLVLTEAQRKNGCVLIDIGSNVTSVLVFHDGMIKYIERIDIGGNHFTNNIAQSLNLTFDLAEDIKKSYATAVEVQIQQEEEILVQRDNNYVPIKRRAIYEAIDNLISEFVECVFNAISRSNQYQYINDGVKMIGGGALLHGLIERIEERTNLVVTLGQFNNYSQKSVSNAALYSTAISLAQKGFEDSVMYNISRKNHAKWSERLISRVNELYQEYF